MLDFYYSERFKEWVIFAYDKKYGDWYPITDGFQTKAAAEVAARRLPKLRGSFALLSVDL